MSGSPKNTIFSQTDLACLQLLCKQKSSLTGNNGFSRFCFVVTNRWPSFRFSSRDTVVFRSDVLPYSHGIPLHCLTNSWPSIQISISLVKPENPDLLILLLRTLSLSLSFSTFEVRRRKHVGFLKAFRLPTTNCRLFRAKIARGE